MRLPTARLFVVLVALAMIIIPNLPQAQTAEINIMAGPPQSTSLSLAQDVRDMGASCGIDMTIHQSSGALDNLLAVKSRRFTQMGIIQSDVLEYLKTYEPDVPDIADAMRGIKVAFPLYQQEVQILARKDITSFADLEGKLVAIGDPESGTFLTATVILDLSGFENLTRLPQNPDTALPALIAGDIDALFFVDGVPSPVFAGNDFDASNLHIVSIDDPVLSAVYEPAMIEAGTYPFVVKDTPTVAVRAVMLAFDYRQGRNNYNTINCRAVSSVSNLIAQKLPELRETGHPKWNEVDPAASFEDWSLSNCSNRGLQQNRALACEAN
jgi:TRAP transporter TAXI family solute receptor